MGTIFLRPTPAPSKTGCLSNLTYDLHVRRCGVLNERFSIPHGVHVQGPVLHVGTVGSMTVLYYSARVALAALSVVLILPLLRAMCLRNIEGLTHSARHLHSLIGLSSRRRAELRYFFRVVRADRALLHLRAVPPLQAGIQAVQVQTVWRRQRLVAGDGAKPIPLCRSATRLRDGSLLHAGAVLRSAARALRVRGSYRPRGRDQRLRLCW